MPNRPERPKNTPLNGTIKAPVDPSTLVNEKNITAMTRTLMKFTAELIDPSDPNSNAVFSPRPGVLPAEIPDMNTVLSVMGRGIYEISKLLKAHEELKGRYSELYSDAMKVHMLLDNLAIRADSMEQGVEHILGRHQQALDVIRHVAEKDTSGPAKAFVENMEKRVSEHKALVNENKDEPPLDSTIIPLPKQS